MRNIMHLDLNLLVTLEALLAERNVTRAARRLHLSQPSVSIRLNKLRCLFDDPLLLPGPRGMLPTARALELLEPLRDALASMSRILDASVDFDPAKARVTWHIASADYAEHAILLPVLTKVRKLAPLAQVAVHPLAPQHVAKMAEMGVIDLAIITAEGAPTTLRQRVLLKERYVLAARKGHPALNEPITVAKFCDLDYVIVSPEGGGFTGPTDAVLAVQGKKRRIAVSVPHFLFVPELLRQSDLVAMLPSRMLSSRAYGLQVIEAPISVPSYDMLMVWHERSHLDPAHRWLRQLIVDTCKTSA